MPRERGAFVSFIRTGLRELRLKVGRQRTRMALRREKRHLQRAEIHLGREGVEQAGTFPELRSEIVALRTLEQEQREVTVRITQLEEALKKIELERQHNAREQNAAIGKLEEEKKPFLQQRALAKSASDVCDRELAAVERRLQDNDTADREILRQLATLQAQAPPPADLDSQASVLGTRRARLPDERAELVRARLGSADACRVAKEKLTAADSQLATADANIARVREEFESRDRTLNEKARGLQDQLREARQQHQTVEERKNPAYLNIGRHLASRGIPPPNAPHLLHDVQRRRGVVERHVEHTSELVVLSRQIDKQELRKFYFTVTSIIVLLAILLPLVIQTPPRREWLPQETESIVSLNVEQLGRDDFAKRWRNDQPDSWQRTWNGLLGNAVVASPIDTGHDVLRITRAAITEDSIAPRDFVLIETKGDVSRIVRRVGEDKSFERTTMSGLPIWRRPELAITRLGPTTIAVGKPAEVDELVRVRLGVKLDLKITGQMFDRFQALDKESTLRLITREPGNLARVFHPLFTRELLADSNLFGFALALHNPVRCRLFLAMSSNEKAAALERDLRADPQRFLRVESSDALLFEQPPEIERSGHNLELRFAMPEDSAKLLLQRLAKTDAPATVAAQ